MEAQAHRVGDAIDLNEKEMKSRVSAIDLLSDRINKVENGLQRDLP